jgi:hypothetical protein
MDTSLPRGPKNRKSCAGFPVSLYQPSAVILREDARGRKKGSQAARFRNSASWILVENMAERVGFATGLSETI